MELTITIKAPELAHALETLAIAIGCTVDKIGVGEAITEAVTQAPSVQVVQPPIQQTVPQIVQTMLQAPVQTQPLQQAPIIPQQPMQQQQVQQAPIYNAPILQQNATVPTQAQTYTMDQLAVAATQLMDAGKRNDLINLLGQFNVPALTALPKDQYGAFATALRGMGAKI